MATPKPALPLLSVVVPSFNQEAFLREALDSIFRQNYPHLEVVVMDGGSTDGSVAVIKSYTDRLAYWQSRPDGGQSAAINAGVEHCSGDLVAWLNSDDFYWGDALWTVARAYQQHPGRGLYIGNGFRYDQGNNRYIPFISRHVAFNREALRHGPDYIIQPSTFFLRAAWRKVGGLDTQLQFCMDWDIFLRIAREHAAVVINEFLGVSREYESTKTRSGGLKRANEILRMVQSHTGQELTPGSLLYMIATLHELTGGSLLGELRAQLGRALGALSQHFSLSFGGGYWTPESSDRGDRVYIPLPQELGARDEGRGAREEDLSASSLAPRPSSLAPKISLIVPCLSHNVYLEDTLQSFFTQQYGALEVLVVGSPYGSKPPEAIEKYGERLTYWRGQAGRGPAGAVNEGLARAGGEVLGWVTPGDLLTAGSLRAVGRAFADDPELDLVYANAAYVDGHGQAALADHGEFRSGFCYGSYGPPHPKDREYPHAYAVPQPTIFFRRRLLERLGPLDESYRAAPDYDLFLRYARAGKVKKIERTQALCRLLEVEDAGRWNDQLVELYRLNRAGWPAPWSRGYFRRLRGFLRGYTERKLWGIGRLSRWLWMGLAGLAAVTRLANPERWRAAEFRVPAGAARLQVPPPRFMTAPVPMDRIEGAHAGTGEGTRPRGRSASFSSLVCAPYVPAHPGRSCREEREYQFLHHLMGLSTVQLFSHRPAVQQPAGHRAALSDALYTPVTLSLFRPDLVSLLDTRPRLRTWAATGLRRQRLPILGPSCPVQVTQEFLHVRAFARPALQDALDRQEPDFLFVMPQTNPVALTLSTRHVRTRLILLAHRVEKDAMSWMARTRRGLASWAYSLETKRAHRFERRNLSRFDGVIVSSAEERERLVQEYGYPKERILVVPPGVDAAYWTGTPRGRPERVVVFQGSLQDERTRAAAVRLLHGVWPRVRSAQPQAELWLLNPDAEYALPEADKGSGVSVFHQVNDVRLQLGRAAAVCLPLPIGGGHEGAVLETLASAVPLVCTGAAAALAPAAQDGVHLLTGETNAELAAAVCRLLEDEALGERLGRSARELVRDARWEKCLAPLGGWLKHITGLPQFRHSRHPGQLRAAG